jgi:hypothetical protein
MPVPYHVRLAGKDLKMLGQPSPPRWCVRGNPGRRFVFEPRNAPTCAAQASPSPPTVALLGSAQVTLPVYADWVDPGGGARGSG